MLIIVFIMCSAFAFVVGVGVWICVAGGQWSSLLQRFGVASMAIIVESPQKEVRFFVLVVSSFFFFLRYFKFPLVQYTCRLLVRMDPRNNPEKN